MLLNFCFNNRIGWEALLSWIVEALLVMKRGIISRVIVTLVIGYFTPNTLLAVSWARDQVDATAAICERPKWRLATIHRRCSVRGVVCKKKESKTEDFV